MATVNRTSMRPRCLVRLASFPDDEEKVATPDAASACHPALTSLRLNLWTAVSRKQHIVER